MGKFEILKTKKIVLPSVNVVTQLDKNVMTTIDGLNKKLGQYKSIIVCEIEGVGYEVVDGSKYFQLLKRNGEKKVLCYNLGKIKNSDKLLYRIALNTHQSRLDYLGIAEIISHLSKSEHKNTIANKTGLDLESVEKYSTLLDFDWNDFNRKQFNSQFNPFEDER